MRQLSVLFLFDIDIPGEEHNNHPSPHTPPHLKDDHHHHHHHHHLHQGGGAANGVQAKGKVDLDKVIQELNNFPDGAKNGNG